MSKKYTFREITEKDELEKFFRMRYEVYSNCRMNSFIKANKHLIDIDSYDVHSRHYSLTCENEAAGYLRVVLPKEEITQNHVLDLEKKYQTFNDDENSSNHEIAPFPFLSYKAVPQSYRDYYNSLSARNEKIAEASRLVLKQEFRTIRTSKFIIESAIVLYILIYLGMKYAIVSCFEDHASFYKHYGFKEISNSKGYQIPTGIGSSLFLTLSLSSVPQKNHSRFLEMAEELKTTNKITKTL